jgi:beta-lactamase regulating signal transducer with metallopeptidase domain
MRFLEQFAPGPYFGWLALAVMLQVTTVILVAAIIARTVLKRRPAARHVLWLCCLGCVFLSPAVAAALDRARIALVVIPWTPNAASQLANVDAPLPDSYPDQPLDRSVGLPPRFSTAPRGQEKEIATAPTARAIEVSSPMAVSSLDDYGAPIESRADSSTAVRETASDSVSVGLLQRLLGALVLTWALGIMIGLARLVLAGQELNRLRRSLAVLESGEHAGVLREVRQMMGLDRLPPVFTSAAVSGPVAIGILRGGIVLPRALLSSLSPSELRDVLVHEVAHLMRWDPLVALLQRIAGVVHWPHPLVHVLNVQLARSREEVCDNFVLRGGDPCGYARTLLHISEFVGVRKTASVGLGLSDRHWTLRDRVAGILDPARDGMTGIGPSAAVALALGLAAICVAIGAVRPLPAEPQQAEIAVQAATVKPERIVRGTVVDERGLPKANVSVGTVSSERMLGTVTTAADGAFVLRLGGFMRMEEDLIASADDGRLMGLAQFIEPREAGSGEPVRIVLKASRATKVHVRDANDRPAAGANVAAVGFDYYRATTTDAGGVAVLQVPADAHVWWIAGLKAGSGFDYFENDYSKPAGEIGPLPAEVTITLDGSRTVRIKAVDSAGQPVRGVDFAPWYIRKPEKLSPANFEVSPMVRGRTDESGVATFGWLPPNVEDDVPFVVFPDEYSCPMSPMYRSGADGVVLEARLLRHTRIAGVVRQANGRPAAGVLIRAEGRGATNHYCRRHARTGEDGSYSLDVYPDQSYLIAVLDDRWAARSLTGVIVREGKPIDGLDFTLATGTLIHGTLTKGAGGPPLKGEVITLVEQGQKLPQRLLASPGGEGAESLPQSAPTDASGRYQFRVGPGHFKIRSAGSESAEEINVENQAEIVHDFRVNESSEWKSLSGVAIERAASGERSISRAIIEAAPIGRHGTQQRTVADLSGRFALSVPPGSAYTILTRDPKGALAGFTRLAAGASDVRVFAAAASRISGKVVDPEGRPVSGRRVQLQIATGMDFQSSSRFSQRTMTDAGGRYDFRGVVVGARAEVFVSIDADTPSGRASVERLEVRSPDPIEMPDVVTLKPREKDVARAPVVAANAAAAFRPVAPTRPELEGVLREIARDPVTPEMVDQAWLLTRPQFYWHANLGDIRENLADGDFRRLIDEAARELYGKVADTLNVFIGALHFSTDLEIGSIKGILQEAAAVAARPGVRVRGTVVDGQAGRPIVGALVYSEDTITRTDAAGAFQLEPKNCRPKGMIWIEAEGYALREYPALGVAAKPGDARIVLASEELIAGRALGPDNRPVADATISVLVKHFQFQVPRPSGPPAQPNYGFPIEVKSGADGWYALRGLPAGLEIDWFEIRHPEFRTAQDGRRVLRRGEANDFAMRSGCKVSGVVVDEAGRPLAGALAQMRQPSSGGGVDRAAQTGLDGRFRFGNVAPGLWTVVIQPRRHAPAHGTVVTTVDRAVESQYVVGPSSYISGRVVGPDGQPVEGAPVGWAKPVDEHGEAIADLELGRITYTAKDGTFRFGPIGQGAYSLTGMAASGARRIGYVTAKANSPDAVIRLEPDTRR